MSPDPFSALRRSLLASMWLAQACVGGAPKDTEETGDIEPLPEAPPCEGAALLSADGQESGFIQCEDGSIQRAFAATCDPTVGVMACPGLTGTSSYASGSTCATDTDCGTGEQCLLTFGSYWGEHCTCAAPCSTDADCGDDGACVCAGTLRIEDPWASCVQVHDCKTGADCPSSECGVSQITDDCGWDVSLACRAEGDDCRSDEECDAPGTCNYTEYEASWDCREYPYGICGRPLLVEGRPQTAPPAARGDWAAQAASSPHIPSDPSAREALARHWEAIAAMEHASVASFARFTLQLLSLGAPPSLLVEASEASLDEIAHAQLAFALCAAYGGRAVGPGALSLQGMQIDTDRRAILRGIIEEACVGETVSVAEARVSAERSEDPAVRAIQARIADDEQRHAALAWKALRLLLQRSDDAERAWVREIFDAAVLALLEQPDPDRPHLPQYGVIGGRSLAQVRRIALKTVVLPCAEALLAQTAHPR